ncbi:WD repeat-containing protein 20 isoform X1 [Hermetia illucens]|uniref:WD repeat-containing protein 20 isoform X1 n=1 Tax=Hermetia illucens TaxID=343691 RepID=UPI0018CC1426|nr:WD repeat-containing protein 20 isoform X1 [Hermetia illucens]XP_037911516.1 WD repeat-containing protein 20 isoform X1 [Hermetia illucens]
MAMQLDPNVKDDLKTQFVTREGTYRLMTLSEYSRPSRVGYTNSQSSPQVRVSIVTLPNAPQQAPSSSAPGAGNGSSASAAAGNATSSQGATGTSASTSTAAPAGVGSNSIESRLHGMHMNDPNGMNGAPMCGGDRICFNFGKELYVYAFRGVKKGSELSKPIDKKLYKGTNPSCHDFNATTATPDGAPLLVGFTTGQIQLAQPGRQPGKLYNEERLIDKTKVTCLKWLPGSPNLFLASHASGHLYLYNEELPCTPTAPNYQPFKMGDGYTILTCKSKSTRNPLYKWVFGTENCSINEFSFSPCGSNLAIVSQDGFLRVFHYDTMELLGIARSYFGGFLCVCWSPDGKYIVVGGEDDLVTVWSLHERRVVARGQGHRSWVSVVAFDPYTTSYTNWDGPDFSDDENPMSGDYRYCGNDHSNYDLYDCEKNCNGRRPNSASFRDSLAQDKLATSYRLGSVSQDTQLCLWDITEDVLRHPLTLRQRVNSSATNDISSTTATGGGNIQLNGDVMNDVKVIKPIATTNTTNNTNNKDDNSCNTSSKNSSNSSSSKFSTANCTISSSNDSGGGGGGGGNSNCNFEQNNKNSTSSISNKQNSSNKQAICVGNSTSKSDTVIGTGQTVDNSTTTNKSSSGSSSKSSDSSSGLSAFNSLTQRLSNFTFGSDKKSSSSTTATNNEHHHSHQNNNRQNHHNHHRKTFSLSKSSGSYHSSSLHHNNFNGTNLDGGNSLTSLKNSKSSQSSSATSTTISTYDPMKLIGTPACPRFDECPLLEPLICKKIAHERLTALIFREDCFLTACQDGFIYTWARPGYSRGCEKQTIVELDYGNFVNAFVENFAQHL